MKDALKKKWIVPVAAAVMTLSIGGAAFAASSADTTTTAAGAPAAITSQAPAGSTSSNPWGNQRSDETLLTGDALAKVTAIAQDKAGTGATIVRVETDAEASESGHGAYEAHVVTAAGTAETIYVDSSFTYVSTETMQGGGQGGQGNPGQSSTGSSTGSTSSTGSSSSVSIN